MVLLLLLTYIQYAALFAPPPPSSPPLQRKRTAQRRAFRGVQLSSPYLFSPCSWVVESSSINILALPPSLHTQHYIRPIPIIYLHHLSDTTLKVYISHPALPTPTDKVPCSISEYLFTYHSLSPCCYLTIQNQHHQRRRPLCLQDAFTTNTSSSLLIYYPF